MNPVEWVDSLMTGAIQKKRIEDMVNNARVNIDQTIPSYASAHIALGDITHFAHKHVAAFQQDFTRAVNTKIRGNFLSVIYFTLLNVEKHYDKLGRLISKNLAQDILKEGMTYRKAAILQHLEAVLFVTQYSNRLLSWVYDCEAEANGDNFGTMLTLAQVKWLSERREVFYSTLELFQNNAEKVEKDILATPEALVNKESEEIIQETQGYGATDPTRMGFIGGLVNPILHLRKFIAEYQVEYYEEAVNQQRVLELKALRLKQARSGGEVDPQLERQIAGIEKEIVLNQQKIHKWETDYVGR
jgi:23S rRNA maturation mini-RNase III